MATAVPTAADLTAAVGAGPPPQRLASRSAWRRAQRRATLLALRGRLETCMARDAFGREAECLSGAPGDAADDATFAEELAQRLVLLAPALAAGLRGFELAPLARRRRNAAAHCFKVAAADIAAADSTALNRFQRGGGGDAPPNGSAKPAADGTAGKVHAATNTAEAGVAETIEPHMDESFVAVVDLMAAAAAQVVAEKAAVVRETAEKAVQTELVVTKPIETAIPTRTSAPAPPAEAKQAAAAAPPPPAPVDAATTTDHPEPVADAEARAEWAAEVKQVVAAAAEEKATAGQAATKAAAARKAKTSVDAVKAEIDDATLDFERKNKKQRQSKRSKAKRNAAEEDLLNSSEGLRELLTDAGKGDKQVLEEVFGDGCARYWRIKFIMDAAELLPDNEEDQRWKHLKNAMVTGEEVLKKLGIWKTYKVATAEKIEKIAAARAAAVAVAEGAAAGAAAEKEAAVHAPAEQAALEQAAAEKAAAEAAREPAECDFVLRTGRQVTFENGTEVVDADRRRAPGACQGAFDNRPASLENRVCWEGKWLSRTEWDRKVEAAAARFRDPHVCRAHTGC